MAQIKLPKKGSLTEAQWRVACREIMPKVHRQQLDKGPEYDRNSEMVELAFKVPKDLLDRYIKGHPDLRDQENAQAMMEAKFVNQIIRFVMEDQYDAYKEKLFHCMNEDAKRVVRAKYGSVCF